MKQALKQLFVASLLVGALAIAPSLNAAESTNKPQNKATGSTKEATEKTPPKRDWYPFGGTVASVNKAANTISLKKKEGERVLKLDSKSTLEVDGKPAVIGTVKVGNYAHGKLHKDSSGNEVIMAAKFDKEPPKKATEPSSKDASKAAHPASKQ
jgi:hypothetical protein